MLQVNRLEIKYLRKSSTKRFEMNKKVLPDIKPTDDEQTPSGKETSFQSCQEEIREDFKLWTL